MREALHDCEFRRAQRQKAIEEIGRLCDEGIASGPASDGEEAFARIRKKLANHIGALRSR